MIATLIANFHGYSHYHAANMKLERRAGDLGMTAIYTWMTSRLRRAWAQPRIKRKDYVLVFE